MKLSPSVLKSLCVATLLCSGVWTTNAQNILVNPGFELTAPNSSGNMAPGWTNVDSPPNPFPFSGVGSDAAFAHSGTNYAFLGASPSFGSLSQSFSTTIGRAYTLSFFLANDSGVPPNAFQVLFGGVTLLNLASAPQFGYTEFSYSGLIASGTSTTLEFRYMHQDDFFRLDDVTVAAVPELSSTLWLAFPTLAGLCLLHFSRSKGRKALV